jgi:hypothetical protein
MLKGIFLLWFCLLPALALGSGLNSEEGARALAERVMKEAGADNIIKGIEHLRPFHVHAMSEFDASLGQIKAQLPDMRERFGNAIGYDFVAVEKIGDSLRQFVYLQKFEKHVLVWRFIFYKPRDQWLLNTFYFDDKVQMLFVY